MFNKIKSLFLDKTPPVVVSKQWRPGMWVVHNTTVGILHKLGEPCEIHLVDETTGETKEIVFFKMDSLRQATYLEIPKVRRNISAEKAKELGYAS